jgi:hypothetical protein
MSFFTYYGKLNDELFVVILPNGTIEVDDPVHLYTNKQFMSYRARDVSITDEGEDCITFHDGYYSFEVVSSKVYQALSLTRKAISSGETATVTLTRHYDQPQTSTPQADRPKIWTGTISFHDWAKNESFVVVAPQGLGNNKPVVAMWQWTKDSKGTPKTLSYGVSEQASDASTSETFSFKQNGYYTLSCQVNPTTKGLSVTVKAPTNADKVQDELVLAHQSELGAEHRFTPPRSRFEKMTLECSLPNAKPSLPRISAALPFPADLVETLSYSAAYLDQAGYLAKYAVNQFEKLDRSYHLLEKKAEARAVKVIKLDGDVTRLTSESQGLTKRNADLEKQVVDNRKEAEKREVALEERLQKTLAGLQGSESREKKLEAENKKLRKHIAKDLIEDMEREQENKEHIQADHKAIDLANEALREAQHLGRHLQEELEYKNNTIAELEACLEATRCELAGAGAEVLRLAAELVTEKHEKTELKEKLDAALHKLEVAEADLAHLQMENTTLNTHLEAEQKRNVEVQNKLTDSLAQVKKGEQAITELTKKICRKDTLIEQQTADFAGLEAKMNNLKRAKTETEQALKELNDPFELAKKDRDAAEEKVEILEKELRGFRIARANEDTYDVKSDIKSDVNVSTTEISI